MHAYLLVQMCEALELLRLADFFGNSALVGQLAARLAAQLDALDEAGLLEVMHSSCICSSCTGCPCTCCIGCSCACCCWCGGPSASPVDKQPFS